MKKNLLSLTTYQPPQAEVIDMMPSRIICGSNEEITPGDGDIDWAPDFNAFNALDGLFDGLL